MLRETAKLHVVRVLDKFSCGGRRSEGKKCVPQQQQQQQQQQQNNNDDDTTK